MNRTQSGPEEGRREGLRLGLEHGWRDGARLAAAAACPQAAPDPIDLRVLYVKQGFVAIDDGVAGALGRAVGELRVTGPDGMLAAAREMKPDLMLVLNGLHVFPEDHLRQADAVRDLGIRTAIWFADDPYFTADTLAIAPHYDTVFTHERAALELYRGTGCADVRHLPFAACRARFRPYPVPGGLRNDIVFIGQGFSSRIALIDAIAPFLAERRVFIAGGLWDRLAHYGLLKDAIRLGWLPVDESVDYYNGASVVINMHRPTEPGDDNRNDLGLEGRSINPRTFEIAACGAFQLTDIREDLTDFYRPGVELETYTGPDELAAKLAYYLEHPEERDRIAVRGLIRTLREHSYDARIGRMLAELGYGAGSRAEGPQSGRREETAWLHKNAAQV